MKDIHTRTSADAEHRPGHTRTRWAAIGAAVAVTLGAGGLGVAQATVDSGEKPVFIAIEPCRLVDTRPEFQVGSRATPLNADETYTLVCTGAQGDCNVPAGVSSLSMNITAVNATAPTFLRFAPGTTVPAGEGSSLNPVPGSPPTPNAVTTSINDSGQFSAYNLAGTVDIIIDVVGYFDHHVHTGDDIVDGTLTGADIEDGSLTSAHMINEPGIVSRVFALDGIELGGAAEIGLIEMNVPSAGFVTVNAVGSVVPTGLAYDRASCKVNHSGTAAEGLWVTVSDAASSTQVYNAMSLHRTVAVEAGLNSFQIICVAEIGESTILDVSATAMFTATSYPNN